MSAPQSTGSPTDAPARGSLGEFNGRLSKLVAPVFEKLDKLRAENAQLKESLNALRGANSRPRRIPRGPTGAAPPAAPES